VLFRKSSAIGAPSACLTTYSKSAVLSVTRPLSYQLRRHNISLAWLAKSCRLRGINSALPLLNIRSGSSISRFEGLLVDLLVLVLSKPSARWTSDGVSTSSVRGTLDR
jgi:hypothetical protein